MPSERRPTLDELLEALVAETPGVDVLQGTDHFRNGVIFAARTQANIVELRLGADIADAALRTPGTSPSPRGEGWVRLQPGNWSDARDRLKAWYRVAWRLAAKGKR